MYKANKNYGRRFKTTMKRIRRLFYLVFVVGLIGYICINVLRTKGGHSLSDKKTTLSYHRHIYIRQAMPNVTVKSGLQPRPKQPFLTESGQGTINKRPSTNPGVHHYDVMINGYMRSGSTFIGGFIGHRKDAFYWYEPLLKTHEFLYYQGENATCEYTKPKCYMKNETKGKHLDEALTFLQHIYECKLAKHVDMVSTTTMPYCGSAWTGFKRCYLKEATDENCIALLEKECQQSTYRVTKVLRMSVESLGHLLQLVPSLRVVHLLRDPRAIINSHLKTQWYPLSNTSDPRLPDDIEALCTRMLSDVTSGISLMRKFPGRFGFIHYEDIASSRKNAEQLMDVLSVRLSVKDRIRVRARPRDRYNGFFYRTRLPYEVVLLIDKYCASAYQSLGLRTYRDVEEYKDVNILPVIDNTLPYTVDKLFKATL